MGNPKYWHVRMNTGIEYIYHRILSQPKTFGHIKIRYDAGNDTLFGFINKDF
jgi:hypothetical protein